MPQELQVLKCFNCQMFQVHIVKKVAKWDCKMCGERQSVIKVYGIGTGRECRLIVQELNRKSISGEKKQSEALVSVNQTELLFVAKKDENKWQQFVECKKADYLSENVSKRKFQCNKSSNVNDASESETIKKKCAEETKPKTNIFEDNEDLSDILNF